MRALETIKQTLLREVVMIRHIFTLLLLGGVVMLLWTSSQNKARELEEAREAEAVNDGYADDIYEEILSEYKKAPAKGKNPYFVPALIGTGCLVGYAGYFLIGYLLPNMAQRATDFAYGSGDMIDEGAEHKVSLQELLAAEDWEGAREAYEAMLEQEPGDREMWMKLVTLLREEMGSPAEGLSTLRKALDAFDWPTDDAAFLHFRCVDILEEEMGDKQAVVETLRRIASEFPDTRHFANAKHKLREMGEV